MSMPAQLLSSGIPAIADHPLWRRWSTRGYNDDMGRYAVKFELHHYVSSFASLMSILSSETFWASDVQYLNDSTEFDHGIPICLDALGLLRRAGLQEHTAIVERGLLDRFRQRTFVTCFSTANDLRQQWENYADSKRGFVLTFDTLVLSALAPPNGLRLMPVEYGDAAQKDRARRTVQRAIHDLQVIAKDHGASFWTSHARVVLLAAELSTCAVPLRRRAGGTSGNGD